MRYVVEWNAETRRWMVWDRDRACVCYQTDDRQDAIRFRNAMGRGR